MSALGCNSPLERRKHGSTNGVCTSEAAEAFRGRLKMEKQKRSRGVDGMDCRRGCLRPSQYPGCGWQARTVGLRCQSTHRENGSSSVRPGPLMYASSASGGDGGLAAHAHPEMWRCLPESAWSLVPAGAAAKRPGQRIVDRGRGQGKAAASSEAPCQPLEGREVGVVLA